MTKEEEAEREAAIPPEIRAEQERRDAFDEKHARCEECGQFLKKRPPAGLLDFQLFQSKWIGHHVQDYQGEWEHI